MSAGTLTLSNNSTAVVGTGTAFSTDLKSGDFIVVTIGGILYTLPVDAVTSNTAATIVSPFTGPTTTGAAWNAVPRKSQNQVTADLVAQSAAALRGMNNDKANWQSFYSGTGDITITLPDGTVVSGPSWAKMSGLVDSSLQWRGALPATPNLNSYGPIQNFVGSWGMGASAGAQPVNGFPEANAVGLLEVFAGGQLGGTQRYTVRNGNIYVRSLTAAWNGTDGPWGDWQPAGKKLLNDLGIGLSTQSTVNNVDWQQVDFVSEANYVFNSSNWTNAPAGLVFAANQVVFVEVISCVSGGTVIELILTANASADANFYKYEVRIANAKGARTFSVRSIFTSADTIPIANGGTGARTAEASLQALIDGKPLPLAADGILPNHAVSVRQIANIIGSSNADMNGVMSDFIGAVTWFNGDALNLPAGYVAASGQTLTRAAYPELWAAVNSGFVASTATDAAWLTDAAGPNAPQKAYARGKYSPGDGSTTFRVPDLNGIQPDSVPGLFLRGSGSANNGSSSGVVRANAAPGMTGKISFHGAPSPMSSATGVFTPDQTLQGATVGSQIAGYTSTQGATFNAATANPAYGRDATSEVRPNSVKGVWVIRASGAFNANSNFHVITGDAAKPSVNSTAYGGELVSEYQVAGKLLAKVTLRLNKTIGGTAFAEVVTDNSVEGGTSTFPIGKVDGWQGGTLTTPLSVAGNITSTTAVIGGKGVIVTDAKGVVTGASGGLGMGWNTTSGVARFIDNYAGGTGGFEFTMANLSGAATNQWFMNPNGTMGGPGNYVPGSDERHKSEIEIVTSALEAVCSWRGVTYIRKDGDGSREVGLIAQDVEKDCPEAIYTSRREFLDGEIIEDFKSLNVSGAAAAYHTEAIKELKMQIDELRAEIVALKAM